MAHSVSISWTASTDAVDGYNVYKGSAAGSEATKVNTALITTDSFVDTTAAPGDWFYAVKSSLGGVESLISNSIEARILPAAPTNVVLVSAA